MSESTSIPLTVKWGKETLDFPLQLSSTSDTSYAFKALTTELEERTGVPADRMKVMAKTKGLWKGVLKEDSAVDWTKAAAVAQKKPLQILLMGSATKLAGPKTKTVFLEDLPPELAAKAQEPAGLVNLGNTCYMNSVVQCLRAVPGLQAGLDEYRLVQQQGPPPVVDSLGGRNAAMQVMLVSSLGDTLRRLDRQSTALQPTTFLQALRLTFPQFAQTSNSMAGGGAKMAVPMQQDAEEFYSSIMTVLASETKQERVVQAALKEFNANATTPPSANGWGDLNMIDALFGMKMKETLTCDEVAETVEPPVVKYDLQRKLVCNIQGGANTQASSAPVSSATPSNAVTNIQDGIALGLRGSIEKHSEALGRNAQWTRTQQLDRLPGVLVVQFGRFYWKATPDSADHPQGVKCKVMKAVAFGDTLDVYDYCSPEVQAVLKKSRDAALAAEEERIHKKLNGEEEGKSEEKDAAMEDASKDVSMEVADDDDEAAALQAALAMSMEPEEEDKTPTIGPALPPHFQGHYELFAVVTHKGRDADGGHYMGWVKAPPPPAGKETAKIPGSEQDNEDWFVFDDDEVSPCKTEDVLKLKGGGDWHMSYLNFYRAKK